MDIVFYDAKMIAGRGKIVCIKAIRVSEDNIVGEYEAFVRPRTDYEINKRTEDVHNIKAAQVDSGVDFDIAYHGFLDFCEGCDKIVSWLSNAKESMSREANMWILPTEQIKNSGYIKGKIIDKSYSLKDALKSLKITPTGERVNDMLALSRQVDIFSNVKANIPTKETKVKKGDK